jgi:hypothetical protein
MESCIPVFHISMTSLFRSKDSPIMLTPDIKFASGRRRDLLSCFDPGRFCMKAEDAIWHF